MPLILGSKSASTSPMGKLHPVGPSSREHQELSWQYLSTDQKPKFGVEHHLVAAGSMNSSRASGQDFGLQSDHSSMGHKTLLMGGDKVDRNQIHYENSLFSSSLSDLFDRKLKMSSNVASFGQSINVVSSNLEEEEPLKCSEEIEAHIIGNLLPDDDDDLFCGVIEDVGVIARPNFRDETDDDIFCSGGGMELEGDSDLVKGGLNSAVPSGHPFGEQPSRTLFVTNMNSTVEDSELRMLFQQYGDIRSLYTASKHQGFVMITYYDIRAAQSAMKLLQNKPFKGWKLDIHYSVPKDNPSEKDINQGMLVIVNLETSILGDDLRHTFGVYGEVKEICETPHHTFVEFYDVRAAEAARCALNRIDIEGKKVKVEPSGPGSSRWGLMQQLPPELEQEESSGFRQGISPGSSPMRSKGFIPLGTITSHFDNGIVHGQHSAASAPSNLLAQINPLMDSSFHRISPIASVSNHGDPGHAARQMKLGFHGMPTMNNGIGIPYNSSSIMPDMDVNIASRSIEGVDTKYIQRVGSRGLSSRSFEHDEHACAGGPGNGSFPVLDLPYILNSPNVYPHHSVGPILWGNSSSFMKNIPSLHSQQMHGIPRAPSHMLNPVLPVRGAPHMGSPSVNSPMHGTLHVGSAPVNPPIWDRRLLFTGDSAELLTFHPSSLGNTGFTRNSKGQLELVPHNMLAHSKGNGINHVGISSPQQRSHMLNGRNRRSDPNANVADSKKQFELDIDRIIRGEDFRTTLMLKNIPNKYTSKMLLAAIDEHHKGTYDFIYLPIDFKNKCNVGYAFINMVEPQQIIPFFQEFNGRKWEKFNSEKVAFLAYARIQGKAALITHFQNSSLMNEDKRCRPILFHSDGPNAGDQEPFPAGPNIRSRPGRSKTIVNVECKDRSPSTSPTRADFASSSKNSD